MSSIQPFEKTVIKTIVRFSLNITELILNTSATFSVLCYDIDDKLIDTKFVSIEGTDYVNWGNNDSYVIDFVANKLGFVLSSKNEGN